MVFYTVPFSPIIHWNHPSWLSFLPCSTKHSKLFRETLQLLQKQISPRCASGRRIWKVHRYWPLLHRPVLLSWFLPTLQQRGSSSLSLCIIQTIERLWKTVSFLPLLDWKQVLPVQFVYESWFSHGSHNKYECHESTTIIQAIDNTLNRA